MSNVVLTALYALSAGLIVGLSYGFLGLRSPAPPVIALIGLLGMLVGEQAALRLRGLASGTSAAYGEERGIDARRDRPRQKSDE